MKKLCTVFFIITIHASTRLLARLEMASRKINYYIIIPASSDIVRAYSRAPTWDLAISGSEAVVGLSSRLAKGQIFKQVSADGVKAITLQREVTRLSVTSRPPPPTHIQLGGRRKKKVENIAKNNPRKHGKTTAKRIKYFHLTSC